MIDITDHPRWLVLSRNWGLQCLRRQPNSSSPSAPSKVYCRIGTWDSFSWDTSYFEGCNSFMHERHVSLCPCSRLACTWMCCRYCTFSCKERANSRSMPGASSNSFVQGLWMAKWHYIFVLFLLSHSYLEIQKEKKKESLMEVGVLLGLMKIYHLIIIKTKLYNTC